MGKFLKISLLVLIGVIIITVGIIFNIQEKFTFFPEKLENSFEFKFDQMFKEIFIKTSDGIDLHGLLFMVKDPKGLVFFLHGNVGSLRSWGGVANIYTETGYDVFILDFRGYGKSGGNIKNEGQFHSDVQTAYDEMKKRYKEKDIVVMGYSIGTGPATKLASENMPYLLILHAPYTSLPDLIRETYPFLPKFLLKYKFRTNQFIKKCKMPVIIFHGDRDEVIRYNHSLKLQKLFKPGDRLITLQGQSHNGIPFNSEYRSFLKKILDK